MMTYLDNMFDDGITLLMYSITRCNRVDNYDELLKEYICAYPSEINFQDHRGFTALMHSVKYPFISTILIDAEADLAIKNYNSETFFDLVIKNNERYWLHPIFKLLVEKNAPVNIYLGDASVKYYFLRYRLEKNILSLLCHNFGRYVLQYEIQKLNRLSQDVDNFDDYTLLEYAIKELNDSSEDVNYFLTVCDYIKNLNEIATSTRKGYGSTRKGYVSTRKGYVSTNKYFDLVHKKNIHGHTLFYMACLSYSKTHNNNYFYIIETLAGVGSDLNLKGTDGYNCLLMACWFNLPNLVELLIKLGADLKLTDASGDTALTTSIIGNNYHIGKILIDAGANINIINHNGDSALMLILSKTLTDKNTDLVKYLITESTDINNSNNIGLTPLDTFICHKNFEFVCDHEFFLLMIKKGYKLNHNTGKIIRTVVNNYIQHFEDLDQIKMLTEKNNILKSEIELHPDSGFVSRLSEHFDSLK